MMVMLPAILLLISEQFPRNIRAKPDGLATWMRYPRISGSSLFCIPHFEEANGRSKCSKVTQVALGAHVKGLMA